MEYIKSPMNYIGNKYRIIEQISRFFPRKIGTFVDLFAGGLDVAVNVNAENVICNDINFYVIDLYREFQRRSQEEIFGHINHRIEEFQLSKENQEGFLRFREYYNQSGREPLDFYTLICYSFNYQFRFNNDHQYNSPFGRNRSSFNASMQKNLRRFLERIREFEFMSEDFRQINLSSLKAGDFLYADPPYTISTGSYNDGKRGFRGWSGKDDEALFQLLDELDSRGIRFAMSNVSEHKGVRNEALIQWKKKYHTHRIAFNYDNSNYHAANRNMVTKEILVTNY